MKCIIAGKGNPNTGAHRQFFRGQILFTLFIAFPNSVITHFSRLLTHFHLFQGKFPRTGKQAPLKLDVVVMRRLCKPSKILNNVLHVWIWFLHKTFDTVHLLRWSVRFLSKKPQKSTKWLKVRIFYLLMGLLEPNFTDQMSISRSGIHSYTSWICIVAAMWHDFNQLLCTFYTLWHEDRDCWYRNTRCTENYKNLAEAVAAL